MNAFLLDNLLALGSWIFLLFFGITIHSPGTAEGLAKGLLHLMMLPYMFLIANTIACYQTESCTGFHCLIPLVVVGSLFYIPIVIYPLFIADKIDAIRRML